MIDSPYHAWMNGSFILFGITTLSGAVMVRKLLAAGRHHLLLNSILVLLVLTGTGVVLIGAFPEDVNLYGHLSGAVLQVSGSNIAFILAGIWLMKNGSPAWGIASVVAGFFSIAAFIVTGFVGLNGPVLGLYAGAWERMSVWIMVLWLFIAGWRLLKAQNYPSKTL